MNEELKKGMVVRYKDGWMEVRAVFKNTINLGSIFGSKTKIKGVPKNEVKPDYENWLNVWTKSETYQSM